MRCIANHKSHLCDLIVTFVRAYCPGTVQVHEQRKLMTLWMAI
jgi:hypothetical protein